MRQNKGVLSWELPIMVKSESLTETAKTLCPYDIINNTCSSLITTDVKNKCPNNEGLQINEDHAVTVSLSSSSERDLVVSLKVDLETDFVIQ